MDYLEIEGGHKLSGSVVISGAKNSALAVIGATILSDKKVVLKNLPNVVDIRTMLKLLTMLGAKVELKEGYVVATAPCDGLEGNKIIFDKITVGGTENALMAAAMANGVTEIINAAKEPEITQLAHMINMGRAKVDGIGTSRLTVHGTNGKALEFKETIEIIPDRIEAGTYLCVGAITNSEITLERVNIKHIQTSINKLEEMGCSFETKENSITIKPASSLKGVNIVTTEYPGFPTDIQAQFMAVATVADDESLIEERLFENRFMHVSELNRLGADICLKGNTAAVRPVKELYGATVMATDLRASSALMIAALAAKGTTKVKRIYHLDRGYYKLEEKLSKIGAKIVRGKK